MAVAAQLGTFTFRPVDPHADAELLHGWVTHPKAAFWLMQDADVAAVEAEYARIASSPTHEALIGLHAGEPAFLVERYDPAHDPVGAVYEVQPGDVGMHFLVAPSDRRVHGFTRAVITAVMRFVLADPAARRVIVEPDVRNTAVHALNAAVGFEVLQPVTLPDGKRALLSACTREQFQEATR
jgi:RimJ/RimL family protein N-acetyltransferase